MNKKLSRRVASEEIRGILAELADAICKTQSHVILSMSGNSFKIHLHNCSITITEEGGAA